MTRKPRSKKNLERKIDELKIKLGRRQTRKISRLMNLRGRILFYQNQLTELLEKELVSNAAAGTESGNAGTLSVDTSNS